MHEEKSGPTRSMSQMIGLILGPVLFFIAILFFDLEPEKPIVTRMAAVAILMAVWWITDAIPLLRDCTDCRCFCTAIWGF